MNGALGGESNGHAKLTWARVRKIRLYYWRNKRPKGTPKHESWVTPAEIAKRLHMSVSAMKAILNGKKAWRKI